ncbi:hypothetical protein LJR219_002658 [Phenylobacterium sp. LjRoot219]|uniref:hypothetical protein n=1 Tax=Phenylobacterium sp. LjRoot219 TaxID=3342283 RepID=UPI003ECEDA76
MKLSPPLKLAGMAALGGVCLVSSLLALASINSGGAVRVGGAHLLPLAAGYDRQAQTALSPAAGPPPDVRRAAAEASRSAIAEFPYDTGAWLRLAYLDHAEHGELTPTGIAALSRSYDLVAVDTDFGVWRIAFALENSQALPQPLRASVQQEAAALWTVGRYRGQLRNLRTQLRNPAGRLSLMLWINRLQASDAK